ncbi:MAG: hypothetical protein L6V93_11055 [Clostridiales bacterium]|nr:MAG: hypothetical protein L6V93_11055 [Clostridiales bacterium]
MVVGARSACFLRLQKLGLIIIDEEHEGTYKSESSPRYHTTEVARFRAKSECGADLARPQRRRLKVTGAGKRKIHAH